MQIVTFYSFKGGVGRTMASVNVGVELALSGRRVLLVDFDLEAPGLDTFNLPRPQTAVPGLVDYVTEYVETGVAPELGKFVYKSPLVGTDKGHLWIMPSGKQDEFYGTRLSALNWHELYLQRDGYLLFENLKSQWKSVLQPDYVLIDSRTGLTDVRGICTRQLPDVVTIFFFPNEQNRRGLEKVVKEIRSEEQGFRRKRIQLQFVMSNVPDLDDEYQILGSITKRLKDSLEYDELTATIHHYNSLTLLNQSVFTMERPKSRLAQEYRELAKAIMRSNPEDREGVLEFLSGIASRSFRKKDTIPAEILETRLDKIRENHATDGEILRTLSRIRRRQHRIDEAIALLNQANTAGVSDAELFLARAELEAMKKNTDSAIADVTRVLEMTEVAYPQVTVAVRLLADIAPSMLSRISSSRAVSALDVDGQLAVSKELFFSRESLSIATQILRPLATRPDLVPHQRSAVNMNLSLCWIGLGSFLEAMNAISPKRPDPKTLAVQESFNYAMAEWGETRIPPKDLFGRVVELDGENRLPGPNYEQCLSIALQMLGENERASERLAEARQQMMALPRPEFSAWRYLKVDPGQFLQDLDAIEGLTRGKNAVPEFMHPGALQKSRVSK